MNKKIIWCIILCMCFFAIPNVYAEENNLSRLDSRQLQNIIDSNKGKVIFVNFFATWCPPCGKEIPSLISLAKHYKNNEVMFIGISVDKNVSLVKPFITKIGTNYPIYIATNDVIFKYGVRSIPHNAIYDNKGVLVVNAPGYLEKKDMKNFIDNILERKS